MIQLVHFEGLSLDEAARRAEIPVGTVKSRCFYALRSLATSSPRPARRRDARALPELETVGVYVLGALDDDERREYEAHLETCEECHHEYDQLAHLPALLDLAADMPR